MTIPNPTPHAVSRSSSSDHSAATEAWKGHNFDNAVSAFDGNDDGMLSEAEVGAARWTKLAASDSNGDGNISRAEYTKSASTGIGSLLTKPVEFISNYQEAVEKAKAEGKMLLLMAGNQSCGNCSMMKNSLKTDTGSGLNALASDMYVVCYLDANDPANQSVLAPFTAGLPSGYGLPLTAVVDPNNPDQAVGRVMTGILDAPILSRLMAEQASINRPDEYAEFQASHPGQRIGGNVKGGRSGATSFDRQDKNGDGFISRDEIPNGFSWIKDFAEKVWNKLVRADSNNDGKISRDEYNASRRSENTGGASGTTPGAA
jgi:hypothetical protein